MMNSPNKFKLDLGKPWPAYPRSAIINSLAYNSCISGYDLRGREPFSVTKVGGGDQGLEKYLLLNSVQASVSCSQPAYHPPYSSRASVARGIPCRLLLAQRVLSQGPLGQQFYCFPHCEAEEVQPVTSSFLHSSWPWPPACLGKDAQGGRRREVARQGT